MKHPKKHSKRHYRPQTGDGLGDWLNEHIIQPIKDSHVVSKYAGKVGEYLAGDTGKAVGEALGGVAGQYGWGKRHYGKKKHNKKNRMYGRGESDQPIRMSNVTPDSIKVMTPQVPVNYRLGASTYAMPRIDRLVL